MRSIAPCALLLLAACGGVPASNAPVGAPVEVAAVDGAVPFGEVAVACGVEGAALGTAIAAESGYAIHDTDPSSTQPRAHHITGFADGCPRRVVAALVLFGDVATHEAMMSGGGADAAGDGTEAAYAAIRAEECGAPVGRPCAALGRLAAGTVFVSLYPAFGVAESVELLLHDGAVAATDL